MDFRKKIMLKATYIYYCGGRLLDSEPSLMFTKVYLNLY